MLPVPVHARRRHHLPDQLPLLRAVAEHRSRHCRAAVAQDNAAAVTQAHQGARGAAHHLPGLLRVPGGGAHGDGAPEYRWVWQCGWNGVETLLYVMGLEYV